MNKNLVDFFLPPPPVAYTMADAGVLQNLNIWILNQDLPLPPLSLACSAARIAALTVPGPWGLRRDLVSPCLGYRPDHLSRTMGIWHCERLKRARS
jgi:hypothetical protein